MANKNQIASLKKRLANFISNNLAEMYLETTETKISVVKFDF